MISQAVSSLRVGQGNIRRFRQSGSWGLRFSGLTGSGFHVVLHGSGWLITAHAQPVALEPGDIVLVTSGADHGLSAAPRALTGLPQVTLGLDPPDPGPADFEYLCGAYRLGQGQAHPYLSGMPDPIVVSPDYSRHPQLRSVVSLLSQDEPPARTDAGVTWPALLDLMLVHALRQWLEEQPPGTWPTISDPAITAALRMIHDSPQAQWTVSRLSEGAGMSRAAFTRRFTALVGKPPIRYLMDWRLNYAAKQLRETDAPLAAIARQVGYSTEFAFAAAFRREYGLPPGRFRGTARSMDH
jgi:AraC-like DNA-binding protein